MHTRAAASLDEMTCLAVTQIIWYPLFGQLYVLANHLHIDRSNPAAAIHSMKQVSGMIVFNSYQSCADVRSFPCF
jgi:hypothetical protein